MFKTQVSSGGVLFRRHNKNLEVAMVSVKGGKIWCLPKGIINSDETPEITAVREVEEETGLKGKIVGELGKISYWFFIKEENVKCKKTVYFFLMEYQGGDISKHDFEVDSVSWFSVDEAIKKAGYKSEREILEKAKKKLLWGK
ncbi:MAG: NUDIX hydrolase [Nitrospirae bacterium]|nr:NUDIX hydrolase [Nitrospirota bacterium]